MGAWYGSKATAGLCQPLIAAMPPHATYIETHLGGGAIMQRKPPALRNIGIDRSARSIRAFRCEYEVELVHGCCHRFLSDFPFAGDELVYSDPPYLHRARKSQRRYRYDYTQADHEQLLALLQGLPCAVMLSGYPCELYERALPDWHSLSLQVMNQAGVVTEKVWCNFAPGRVHWHRYAGRNFRHRQCIQRKAANWARRYAAMEPGERLAVLAALMAVEAE